MKQSVALVGLLIGFGVLLVFGYRVFVWRTDADGRTREKTCVGRLYYIRSQVEPFRDANGRYPTNLTECGIATNRLQCPFNRSNYVYMLSADGGRFYVIGAPAGNGLRFVAGTNRQVLELDSQGLRRLTNAAD